MALLSLKSKILNSKPHANKFKYILVKIGFLFSAAAAEAEVTVEESMTSQEKSRAPASYIVPSIDEQKKKKQSPESTPTPKSPALSLPSSQSPSLLEDKDFGLSGNWGGVRENLEKNGYEIALVYKADLNRNLQGGIVRKSAYLDNVDLKMTVDGEKAFGLGGYTFFIYGIANSGADQGGRPTQYVGDAQWTSNIETQTNSYRLYEAWIQKTLYNENSSVLVGIHDLNSEFYVTPSALMFLHSSFGLGLELSQTGTNGSSVFPYTSPAIRFKTESEHLYIQTALFGAQSGDLNHMKSSRFRFGPKDGFLSITEMGLVGDEDSQQKFAIGFWSYTRTFDDLNEVVNDNTGQPLTDSYGNTIAAQRTNQGMYGIIDHSLSGDLSLFSTFGIANGNVNMTESNFTFGINLGNVFSSNNKDRFGLGLSHVTPGISYKRSQRSQGTELAAQEVAFEATYRYEILKGAFLQPDFQYVKNPSYRKDIKDALVGNLRIELNF